MSFTFSLKYCMIINNSAVNDYLSLIDGITSDDLDFNDEI